MNRTIAGKEGEDLAYQFLIEQGYKVIERNFRIRGGEIDIIAFDGKTLVYVEVKTRTQKIFGEPEEAVNFHKLRFLERAAKFYKSQRRILNSNLLERIDVVSVDLTKATPHFKLIKNAGF